MGLDLRFPLIYGMGRGYFVPAEFVMSRCLQAFTNIKQGCVIDVGANVGVYLVKLKVIRDDVDYYGFEPNHACNFYTHELIRRNGFTRAKVFPFALSDTRQLRTLYASAMGDKTGSMLEYTKANQVLDHSFDIYTMVGDEFLQQLDIEQVAVIKIDVEGAELEVLRGLKGTISTHQPYIYCEVLDLHDDDTFADRQVRITKVYELLEELDYGILGVWKDNTATETKSAVTDFGPQYREEYIFSPRDELDRLKKEIESL